MLVIALKYVRYDMQVIVSLCLHLHMSICCNLAKYIDYRDETIEVGCVLYESMADSISSNAWII